MSKKIQKQCSQSEVTSVGIDVSKASLDVCCLHGMQEPVWVSKIKNNCSGIEKLIEKLQKLSLDRDTPIVMEATGDYHFLVAVFLAEAGYNVRVMNPLAASKYCKAAVRKQKTDAIDARKLAEIGLLEGKSLPIFSLTREALLLRKKLNLLNTLSKKQQALTASLKSLKTATLQLQQEPSEAEKLMEKAIESLEAAKTAVVKEIAALQSKEEDPEQGSIVERLKAIPGIGEKAATIAVAYTTDMSFTSKESLIAFSGLDVSTKESGRYQGKQKITKRGAPGFRQWLYHAAWGLSRHCEVFKELYQYYKAQGRHHYEVLVILARKFLKIVYGMMKNGTAFDPSLVTVPKNA